jgi:hypothetical protein
MAKLLPIRLLVVLVLLLSLGSVGAALAKCGGQRGSWTLTFVSSTCTRNGKPCPPKDPSASKELAKWLADGSMEAEDATDEAVLDVRSDGPVYVRLSELR